MDSETELEAKLGDWRTKEEVTYSTPSTPKKLRKRKKRDRPSLPKNESYSSPASAPLGTELAQQILPDTSVSPEVESAALSRTLLQSRVEDKWKPMPGVSVRAKSGIAKKRRSSSRRADTRTEKNAAQLVERFRHEVGALGAAGLQKRERKAYDEAVLDRLGFRRPKNQKMPLTLLEEQRRKEKLRLQQEKEKKLEEGVLLSAKRKNRRR